MESNDTPRTPKQGDLIVSVTVLMNVIGELRLPLQVSHQHLMTTEEQREHMGLTESVLAELAQILQCFQQGMADLIAEWQAQPEMELHEAFGVMRAMLDELMQNPSSHHPHLN